MNKQILSWQSQAGTALSVWIGESQFSPCFWVKNDGKGIESGNLRMLPKPVQVGTILAVACIGNVAITEERFAILSAAWNQLQAAIDARPEMILIKLVAQRESLSRSIGYLLDAQHEDGYRRIEHASEHGFMPKARRDYDAEIAAARAALAQFDDAHPEALVEIGRRKARDIASFLAND